MKRVWHRQSHSCWWFCVCGGVRGTCCGRESRAVIGSEQRSQRWSQKTAARTGQRGTKGLTFPQQSTGDDAEASCCKLDSWSPNVTSKRHIWPLQHCSWKHASQQLYTIDTPRKLFFSLWTQMCSTNINCDTIKIWKLKFSKFNSLWSSKSQWKKPQLTHWYIQIGC